MARRGTRFAGDLLLRAPRRHEPPPRHALLRTGAAAGGGGCKQWWHAGCATGTVLLLGVCVEAGAANISLCFHTTAPLCLRPLSRSQRSHKGVASARASGPQVMSSGGRLGEAWRRAGGASVASRSPVSPRRSSTVLRVRSRVSAPMLMTEMDAGSDGWALLCFAWFEGLCWRGVNTTCINITREGVTHRHRLQGSRSI